MNAKRILVLLLTLTMICMAIAGCSKKGGEKETEKPETPASEENGESEEIGAITWEEPYEVVMTYPYYGTLSQDLQMVQDAMNKIALEKTNTKVSLLPMSFAEIGSQPSLMIASGQKLDLVMSLGQSSFLSYVNDHMLLELNDIYPKYGADIAEDLGGAIAGGYVDGDLYGVPSTRQRATSMGMMLATEYVEKYGLDTSKEVGYEELDEFFGKVKEGEGESFYPLTMTSNTTSFASTVRMDPLGADLACGAIIDYKNSNKIENVFASEEYANHLKWMHKWYEAGYINSDAPTNTDPIESLLVNGRSCGYFQQTYWDMEKQQTRVLNIDMTAIDLTGLYQTTSVFQGQCWCIPYTCKNPEATMAFLNLTYGDRELLNMFYYGIEGVHYELVDDAGIISYLDGKDVTTVTYNNPLGLYGAVDKMYQVNTAWGPEYFEQMEEFNNNIPEEAVSPFLGYAFNTVKVKTAYSAVQNVMTQYQVSLETGSVDPDVILPEFLKALEDAGINEIIEANQASLDEWLANNK